MCPCLGSQAGGNDRPHHLAGVRLIPFGFETFQVLPHLRPTLGHERVERLQLDHLTGHGVQGQAVPVEHIGKVGAGGDHRGAEGADRTLLFEQRGGEQAAPLPGREHAGANLHVNVPVRITRPRRVVRDADDLHLLDGHDFLRSQRPHASDGVLGEPPPNLRQGILLGGIQGVGDLRM